MQIYVLLFTGDPDATFRANIQNVFPDNFYEISPTQWLVAGNKTAEELASALKIGEGEQGQVMMVGVSSYYGWHRKDMWDWMSLKRSL